MPALFHHPLQLPCSYQSSRCSGKKYEKFKIGYCGSIQGKNLLSVGKWGRRLFLEFMGFVPITSYVFPSFAAPPPMMDMKEPDVIRTLKLADGVRIQEIVEGEGPEAHEGDQVEVNYVCRRANGYFVHSTVDQFSGESTPVILPLDGKKIIEGLKEVLIGMRVGEGNWRGSNLKQVCLYGIRCLYNAKRRALIPPSVGYTSKNLMPIPDEFGPRRSLLSHAKEPLVFEVQLLKVL